MAENRVCRHSDIREFGDVRCCLSCGLAIVGAEPEIQLEFSLGSNYQYKPLNHILGQEIRLVELLPGTYEEDLCCYIRHANLASRIHYEYSALSYTWATEDGAAERSDLIHCGPRQLDLAISRNCATALRRLRQQGFKRTIWVDMICIDQRNSEERNHQVALMSEIYSKANQVLIYLGEPDAVSDQVFNFLCNERFDQASRHSRPDFSVLKAFYTRRWFHRVWVIQEVAMARSALVICGQQVLLWDHMSSGLALNKFQDSKLFLPPPTLRIGIFNYNRDQTLLELLIATRRCASSDPRDKVFALLALVSDSERIPLHADYTKSAEWIFVQVAAWFTAHHGDSRILRHAYRPTRPQNPNGKEEFMPSWVPCWADTEDTLSSLLLRHNNNHNNKMQHSRSVSTLMSMDGLFSLSNPAVLDFPMHLGIRIYASKYTRIWTDNSDWKRQAANWARRRDYYQERRDANRERPSRIYSSKQVSDESAVTPKY
jgi:hypothetical protein